MTDLHAGFQRPDADARDDGLSDATGSGSWRPGDSR
jgi:hypothetical protein